MSSNYGSSLRLALKQSLISTDSSNGTVSLNHATPAQPHLSPPRSHTTNTKRTSTSKSPNHIKRAKPSDNLSDNAKTISSPSASSYIGNSLRLAIIQSKQQIVDSQPISSQSSVVSSPTKRRHVHPDPIQYITPAATTRLTIEASTRSRSILSEDVMLSAVLPCLYLSELVSLRRVNRYFYHMTTQHASFAAIVPLLNGGASDSKAQYRGFVRTVGMHTPTDYHLLMPDLQLPYWSHNHNITCHYCAAYQPDLFCQYCNVSYHSNCVPMLVEKDVDIIQNAMAKLGHFVCADCASESTICVAGCPLVFGLRTNDGGASISSYIRSPLSDIAVLGGDEYYSLSSNVSTAYCLHLPTQNWRQQSVFTSSTRYIGSANTHLISSPKTMSAGNCSWLLQFEYVYVSNMQAVDFSKMFVAPISGNPTSNWIQVHIDTNQCFAPPFLVNAAIAVHKGVLVVQGGRRIVDTYSVPCSDIFVLNTDMVVKAAGGGKRQDRYWRKIDLVGLPPPPRYGHTITAISASSYWVFGGLGPSSVLSNHTKKGCRSQKDVYHFELGKKSGKWSAPMLGGRSPVSRCSHSAAAIGNNILIFGGRSGNALLNDCWLLHTLGQCWVQVILGGSVPSKRLHPQLLPLSHKKVVLCGGEIDVEHGKRAADCYVITIALN